MKAIADSLSTLDSLALMVTVIIMLECVVMLREPTSKASILRDAFSFLTGIAALFESVALVLNSHETSATTLALFISLALGLALMIAASVDKPKARERRSVLSQLGRSL